MATSTPSLSAATTNPDPLAFAPVTQALTMKYATVTNSGLASLHVSAIGVASGNAAFSVIPPAGLPLTLKPGDSLQVEVDYARSIDTHEGRLELELVLVGQLLPPPMDQGGPQGEQSRLSCWTDPWVMVTAAPSP